MTKMSSIRPKQWKELMIDKFDVGMNRDHDPLEYGHKQFYTLADVRFKGDDIEKRLGCLAKGTTNGSKKVVGLGVMSNATADELYCVCNQKLRKWGGSDFADTDLTDLTLDLDTDLVSFLASDKPEAGGSATDSGTAESGTTRYFADTDKSWTTDEYYGYAVHITGGTGSGQVRRVASNTASTLYIDGVFDVAPSSDSTYEIWPISPHLFISNGTDNVHKYNGTANAALSGLPKAKTMAEYKSRLFMAGFGDDDDVVKFTERGLGDDVSKYSWIPVQEDGDYVNKIITWNEQLIVFKRRSTHVLTGDTPQTFRLRKRANFGCLAPRGVSVGGNMLLFLSEYGVEDLNRLEADVTSMHVPLSEPINSLILAHSDAEKIAAVGWFEENKHFFQIGDTVYVYHVKESIKNERAIWTYDTRGSASLRANCATHFDGDIYFGDNFETGLVLETETGNGDNGAAIPMTIESGDIYIKDPGLYKGYEKMRVFFETTAGAVTYTITQSIEKAAFESLDTITGNSDTSPIEFSPNKRARYWRFKIAESSTLAPARIHKVQLNYFPIGY